MKKNLMKRILSMTLATIMSLSLCVPAFAADEVKNPHTKAHDMEIKLVEVDRRSFTMKHIGKAGGQPIGGFNLPAGSYLSWIPGGTSSTVTLSVGWGVFTFSTDVGSTIEGTSGVMVPALANRACWLHIYKDLTVIKYEVYERPAGTSWAWSPTGEYITRAIEGQVYVRCHAY